jgi:hypothetical protein
LFSSGVEIEVGDQQVVSLPTFFFFVTDDRSEKLECLSGSGFSSKDPSHRALHHMAQDVHAGKIHEY